MPYRVLTGLSYPPDRRAEVGDIVDDIPPKSVKWLLAEGYIENVGGKAAPQTAPEAPKAQPDSVEDGDE